MYDFGLSCGAPSPGSDPASLWSGAAAPAIDFFLNRIGCENIRFLRPDEACRWRGGDGIVHRYWHELFFQVQGRCRFDFASGPVVALPGDAVAVPTGFAHRESANDCGDKPFFNLVLMISESRASLHIGALGGGNSGGKPVVVTLRLLPHGGFYRGVTAALTEPGSTDEARAALLRSLLLQLAADISLPLVRRGAKAAPYAFACRAKSLLDHGELALSLDVGALAGRLGCSPAHLSHSFHQIYGVELKRYIRELRLEYARQLLSSGRCNIAECAERCGFRDASYFSRRFREHFGIPPAQLVK